MTTPAAGIPHASNPILCYKKTRSSQHYICLCSLITPSVPVILESKLEKLASLQGVLEPTH
jgi:hypothetical protein